MTSSSNSLASTPSPQSWTRHIDASDGTARWVHVDRDDPKHASSTAFVSRLVSSPSHPDGRLIFEDVGTADARMSSRGSEFSDDDLTAATQFATLPLDDKYTWFRFNTTALLRESDDEDDGSRLTLRVKTGASVLAESLEQLLNAPIEHLHRPLSVEFVEDEGEVTVDEWLALTVQELFDETTGLFVRAPSDPVTPTWTINPDSLQGSHSLSFRAVGRLLGRVLLEGLSMTRLARPLLKHLLGEPLVLEDVRALDLKAYETLRSAHETEIDVKELDAANDNKPDFVSRRMQHFLLDAFAEQLDDLMAGLFEVVPQELLLVFSSEELERVLFEPPAIDDAEGDDFDPFGEADPFDAFDPFGDDEGPGPAQEP